MIEKSVLSTKAIIFYVIAAVMLGLGILFATPITKDLFGINFNLVTTGIILLIGGTWLLFPSIKKVQKNLRILLIVELFIVYLIAILGFILPEFVESLQQSAYSVNIWIGLLMIFHGIAHLVVERFSEKKLNIWLFLMYLVVIALGGLITDSKMIDITTLIIVVVVALFALIAGFIAFKAMKFPKVVKMVSKRIDISKEDSTTNTQKEEDQ